MRESVFLELRLGRFEVWRVAIGVVAAAAIAAVTAWAAALVGSQEEAGAALVLGATVLLILATLSVARSLARVDAGILSCRDGVWTFVTDAEAVTSGALEVAIDVGSFLLLRLGDRKRRSLWLPVQRRGLEHEWHALRCAVYSPPPVAGLQATGVRLHCE